MRLIKIFGFATVAVVSAMAFVGATSASAELTTQLCNTHTGLTCGAGNAATNFHAVLATGEVLKLLTSLVDVLCLHELWESAGGDVGALARPQRLDLTVKEATGCGTTSAHNNCTLTTESLPDGNLLKLGLDQGSYTFVNGSMRLQGCSIGLNCLYDLAGALASVGAQHITLEETPTTELGEKFFCPDEALLDALLVTLSNRYVLQ